MVVYYIMQFEQYKGVEFHVKSTKNRQYQINWIIKSKDCLNTFLMDNDSTSDKTKVYVKCL